MYRTLWFFIYVTFGWCIADCFRREEIIIPTLIAVTSFCYGFRKGTGHAYDRATADIQDILTSMEVK